MSTFTQINEGDLLSAPMPENLEYIDMNSCKKEIEEVALAFDINKILRNCIKPYNLNKPVGMHLFDLHFLKYYIKKYKAIKIVEIGCGVSTRFMINAGYKPISYALDDVLRHPKKQLYIYADLMTNEGMDKLLSHKNDIDLLFIDGHHSYDFIKAMLGYVDGFKKKVPVIIHDFLPLTNQYTYGEQYYILEVFLREYERFGYKLKTFSALLGDRFNAECDPYTLKFDKDCNKTTVIDKCMALITYE